MKTKIMRRIAAAIGIASCSLCLLVTPAASLPAQAAAPGGSTVAEPNQDIKEWRFLQIGSKLYKRLWNCSTGEWEGPWIFVRNL